MSSLKKLEQLVCKYASLAKTLIVLFWVLWAVQTSGPILRSIAFEQKHYPNSASLEIRKHALWDYAEFVNAIIERAKTLDKNYTPEQYYVDRKAIDAKKRALEAKYAARINDVPTSEMDDIVRANIRMDYKLQNRIAIAAADYDDWLRGGKGSREDIFSTLHKMKRSECLDWALVLLLRGMLLACLLYLVRMCERKGVVQTILQGKLAFVRSIILWPIYLWRYPFHIIREIRIEAEMRRLGSAFRKLTVAEKLAVQRIASSTSYKEWVNQFRFANYGQFRRSLLVALIPVLLMYFCPMQAHGVAEHSIKSSTGYSAQVDHQCNKAPPGAPMLEPTPAFWLDISPIMFLLKPAEPRDLIPQGVIRDIDHIPLQIVICAN